MPPESQALEELISADAIHRRVCALGAAIRADHGDDPITLVGVLKGSFLFLADLARAIPGEVRVEFLGVASYHGGTSSSGAVQITHDLRADIADASVVVVEDIVDTGLTVEFLRRTLTIRGPRRLSVATLLDKPDRRRVDVRPEYVGFTIPDAFVVGYGLDLAERFRNLPYVAVYRP